MIARLQAFYGGDPAHWFDLRPAVLAALAKMLPRLEAERDLKDLQVIAAGTRNMKPAASKRYVDSLRRRTGLGRGEQQPKSAAEWRQAGMRVTETVKPDG